MGNAKVKDPENIKRMLGNHMEFPQVLAKCCPETLKRLVDGDPEVRHLAVTKFKDFVMGDDIAPKDVADIDIHPAGGQIVGWALAGTGRCDEAGVRVRALLQAAQPKPQPGPNRYPFAGVPELSWSAPPDPYHNYR